jgi:hypothetical protein
MSTVGFSTLDVIPSMKNLRAQLDSQTSAPMAAAGKASGRKFGDAAGKEAGGRFRGTLSPLLRDAFAPLAGLVAGAAVIDLFKGAIGGASDLAESGSKVKQIFGDATAEINKFADQGAKKLGQSKLAVLDAASSFGVFGKAAGLSGSGLAAFSDGLVSLSTDMASLFNTTPADAAEAISAGLRGEAEPLRRYGVLLDDATLRQEALRQGLISTTKQALTPQQKVLAAYQAIFKQTADAQGDFERTSGGLANQSRELTAGWADMRAELGAKLLPAATETVKVFNNGVIPAMGDAGGAVGDAGRAFDSLPTPIKAATGALVAFKIAQAAGVTAQMAKGLDQVGAGFGQVQTRAQNAVGVFKNFRSEVFVAGQAGTEFSGVGTRMAASMEAIRAASIGAGAGLKRGLSGASALVGGPWGAAFIAGTAIVAHFWQEHQQAKQRVEDFTATLDKETGALTASSRELVAKQLLDSGALDRAKKLGISLDVVTDAALGQKDALAGLNAQLDAIAKANTVSTGSRGTAAFTEQGTAAIGLKDALNSTNGTVQQGIAKQKLFVAALGLGGAAAIGAATGTSKATAAVQTYASTLATARGAVRSLMDAEDKRRAANLGKQQDALGLAQALTSARKEAADGARTLDITTEAGQANKQSLLELSTQWDNSAAAVRNAKGAYVDMRTNFINVATSMGATKTQAQKLADQLLDVPKTAPLKFQSEGFKERMAELRRLREALAGLPHSVALNYSSVTNKGRGPALASGGLLRGPGSGTSDSILMWGSNGEYMQRKRAVDYYGVDFMRRLNNLQVPKFAGGGLVGGSSSVVTHGPGVNIESQVVMAASFDDYLRQQNERARMAAVGGTPR